MCDGFLKTESISRNSHWKLKKPEAQQDMSYRSDVKRSHHTLAFFFWPPSNLQVGNDWLCLWCPKMGGFVALDTNIWWFSCPDFPVSHWISSNISMMWAWPHDVGSDFPYTHVGKYKSWCGTIHLGTICHHKQLRTHVFLKYWFTP